MRYLEKELPTEFEVPAKAWKVINVDTNPEQGTMHLRLEGWATAQGMIDGKRSIGSEHVILNGINDWRQEAVLDEAGTVNVYEVEFAKILSELIKTDKFKDGLLKDTESE